MTEILVAANIVRTGALDNSLPSIAALGRVARRGAIDHLPSGDRTAEPAP